MESERCHGLHCRRAGATLDASVASDPGGRKVRSVVPSGVQPSPSLGDAAEALARRALGLVLNAERSPAVRPIHVGDADTATVDRAVELLRGRALPGPMVERACALLQASTPSGGAEHAVAAELGAALLDEELAELRERGPQQA
jgi:hypothetical protein